MSTLTDNESILRWLHILAGITWIGMLYFFNLVNLPLLKFKLKKPVEADMAEKATGNIALKTLFWFRWGAAFTVLFGLILIEVKRQQFGDLGAYFLDTGLQGYAILMGILFGLVMAFNVWFIIWPRQQKIIGNNKKAATASPEEKQALTAANAPLVKEATFASRMNTWLSIPMLWGMVMGAHGYPGDNSAGDWAVPLVILAALVLVTVAYSRPPAAKKA